MRFGGAGWKPGSRRNRRQNRAHQGSTEKGADRTLILVLVVFGVVTFGLVLLIGILST